MFRSVIFNKIRRHPDKHYGTYHVFFDDRGQAQYIVGLLNAERCQEIREYAFFKTRLGPNLIPLSNPYDFTVFS